MEFFDVDNLEYYLSDQYELKPPSPAPFSFDTISKIDFFKNTLEKYSDSFDFSREPDKDTDNMPIQEAFSKFLTLNQQEPRFHSFTIDLIKDAHQNIPKMWESFYFYDEFLSQNLSKMINSVKKEDNTKLMRVIKRFQQERNKNLSLWLKSQSLLSISEVKTEAILKLEGMDFMLKDLDSNQWDLIQKLNQKSTDEQQIHVYQWCREFAGIIENHFKRTIYFITLINNLLKEKNIDNTTNYNFKSIRDVLSSFSKKYTKYDLVKKLPHFRNAVSHETFSWKSSQEIQNSTIRFVDKNWAETISFEQFLCIYQKLVILVGTFEYVIMKKHIGLLDDTKTTDQLFKEFGNQIFQQTEKLLREMFENDKQDKNQNSKKSI